MLRVQIQSELCPVEHFYNLGCGMANVTIAHIPLIPEAPPQPAPSRHPSEKQRLLSHQGAGYHCDRHHGAVGPGGHQSPVLAALSSNLHGTTIYKHHLKHVTLPGLGAGWDTIPIRQ